MFLVMMIGVELLMFMLIVMTIVILMAMFMLISKVIIDGIMVLMLVLMVMMAILICSHVDVMINGVSYEYGDVSPLSLRGECDITGSDPVTLVVGDDLHTTVLEHSHAASKTLR